MSEHEITVDGGTSVRLPTAGKYCDRDILINAINIGDTTLEDGLVKRTLTEYSNDRVTSVGFAAFYQFASLVSVNLPNVKSIAGYGFYNCDKLKELHLPSLTSLGDTGIRSCGALVTFDCPKLTVVGNSTARECTKLTNVNIPSCTQLSNYAFSNCTSLAKIDLPKVKTISTNAFSSCSALETVILRSATLCTLSNTNGFTGTKIASGTGYIYVPAELVDSYKSATNWSTYADQIRAIEDYPEITGV